MIAKKLARTLRFHWCKPWTCGGTYGHDIGPPDGRDTGIVFCGSVQQGGMKYGSVQQGGMKYGSVQQGGMKYGGVQQGGMKYGSVQLGGMKYGFRSAMSYVLSL